MSNSLYLNSRTAQHSLARLEQRKAQMVEELSALVALESPSNSLDNLRMCANFLASMGTSLLGIAPDRIEVDGRVHLLWKFGAQPKVVLVGHYDTVHPLGTILEFPFSIEGDIARGPGVCDMKGGVVIALHAIKELIETRGTEAVDGVWLMVNGDEELGSQTSRALVEELAAKTQFAIGFENAGPDGEIKTERRGAAHYQLKVTGQAAHAGDRSDKGINALQEMCAQCEVVMALANEQAGTSVTPTMASAGTAINTVCEEASMWFDVRVRTMDEQARVDREVRRLSPLVTESKVVVEGGIAQPPLPAEMSATLASLAKDVADELGSPVQFMAVGGAADVCRFAAAGVTSIDGLGAVGGDDHSRREWIRISSMPSQAALAVGMMTRILELE